MYLTDCFFFGLCFFQRKKLPSCRVYLFIFLISYWFIYYTWYCHLGNIHSSASSTEYTLMAREQLFDVKNIFCWTYWQNFILYTKSVKFIVCFVFFSSFSCLRLENFFYDVLHKRLTETYVLLSFWELNIPWCLVRRITGSPRGKVRLVPLYRPQKSKSFKESVVANL